MKLVDGSRPGLARSMKAVMLLGMVMWVTGIILPSYVRGKVKALEREYEAVRASQFRVNVTSSRNHHPHNQYLAWGPQVVTSGYEGNDPKHIYQSRQEEWLSYLPLAERLYYAGPALAMFALVAFAFVRNPRANSSQSEKIEDESRVSEAADDGAKR